MISLYFRDYFEQWCVLDQLEYADSEKHKHQLPSSHCQNFKLNFSSRLFFLVEEMCDYGQKVKLLCHYRCMWEKIVSEM